MVGQPDGEMGPNTRDAINAFRGEHSLPPGENLDQEFMATLAAAGQREISEKRAQTTATDLRNAGSKPVKQLDFFKTIGTITTVLGAAGGADAGGLLDTFKELAGTLNNTASTVSSTVITVVGIVQWCLSHWWLFAVFGGLYIFYRGVVAVLTVVSLFRQNILTRADK
jgi:peptidoglycan hydrolase-like protein with peptidoglycan-binding domain